VHFQVSTGRMPLAGPEAQAPTKQVIYSKDEIAALSAYIASLAPGPASPSEEQLAYEDADVAEGGELFRTNCSQCHNFAGRGGALSDGSYAPSLLDATPQQIYEAMLTGPQQMPVFNDQTLSPEEKKSIIRYIEELKTAPNPGGQDLGSLGPVTEGLFAWVVGIMAFVAVAVWIGAKVR
jgi:ubiquinol-cytochrome c reductase cytochrome c subunit